MATKKKIEDSLLDAVGKDMDKQQTYNPLLVALRDNDKKHLFKTNVTTAFIKTGFHLFDYFFGAVINVHDDLGNLIGQEPRVGQAAGTFNLLIGNSGSGKMQPDSTPIPTPDGWKQLKDIKKGDKVFTIDGSETEVDGVFPHGKKDIYKLTFRDGRTAMAGADHLWEVYMDTDNWQRSVLDTKTLIELIKNNPDIKIGIPSLTREIQYKHHDVSVDPYTFGALLASDIEFDEFAAIRNISEYPIHKVSSINKLTIQHYSNTRPFDYKLSYPWNNGCCRKCFYIKGYIQSIP